MNLSDIADVRGDAQRLLDDPLLSKLLAEMEEHRLKALSRESLSAEAKSRLTWHLGSLNSIREVRANLVSLTRRDQGKRKDFVKRA